MVKYHHSSIYLEDGVMWMKRKHMKREEWHRILQKEYRCVPCEFEGIEGMVSILVLKEVTAPLYVADGDNMVLIADTQAHIPLLFHH